jgi:flagellar biosynthetic protein FliQ
MSEQLAVELVARMLGQVLYTAGPVLAVALAAGLVIGILQAATQINEFTLAFVPKLLAVFAALAVLGPWLLGSLAAFTVNLYGLLPQIGRGGP